MCPPYRSGSSPVRHRAAAGLEMSPHHRSAGAAVLSAIVALARGGAQAAGSLVGIRNGIEEPPHTSERLSPDVEIRRYRERICAETIVTAAEEAARNVGFRRLAGYIFGGNHAGTKFAMTAPVTQGGTDIGERIAMTAPVTQQSTVPGQWIIRFVLPADATMESLPEPNDPAVRLVRIAAATVAVQRFSGNRGPRAVASRTEQLLTTLREYGFEPTGPAEAWFYDPPWTLPLFRRNEIAVPVTHHH